MIPGHGGKLIDHLLADMQPFAHVGLFTDARLQGGKQGRRLTVKFDDRLLRWHGLAVDGLGRALLLQHGLAVALQIQHSPQQRVEVCLLLKLTPVVADSRREPILELKGVLRQNFALALQKIDNFHVPIPIRFKACKEV